MPGNPDHPEREEAGVFLGGDLSLCVTLGEVQAHPSEKLELLCDPAQHTPRSHTDRDAAGQVLRFGQDFCLGITGGFENKMLCLSSDHRALLRSAKSPGCRRPT